VIQKVIQSIKTRVCLSKWRENYKEVNPNGNETRAADETGCKASQTRKRASQTSNQARSTDQEVDKLKIFKILVVKAGELLFGNDVNLPLFHMKSSRGKFVLMLIPFREERNVEN